MVYLYYFLKFQNSIRPFEACSTFDFSFCVSLVSRLYIEDFFVVYFIWNFERD